MFRFSEDHSYSMPAHFGGAQGVPGPWTYADVTTVLLRYETDLDQLSQYVPEGFEVTQPILEIGYQMVRGVEWMAGGHYNLLAVNVPVVHARGGESLRGSFALVIWENKTCPILGGREQTGMPKVFSDVEDLHQIGDRRFANVSYEGATFLAIDVRLAHAMSADEVKLLNREQGRLNWFGWRYFPNIGRPGAALSHATLYPIESVFSAAWTGEGTVRWQALAWEQHPTQAHIIRALSGLPIKAYRGCVLTRGSQVLRTDTASALP